MEERWLAFEGPLDLETTLGPLRCRPGVDPTWRIGPDEALRASVTPDGPATLHVRRVAPGALRARAWGPGAGWALATAPDLLGLGDTDLDPFPSAPPAVRALARRGVGVRLVRTHRVVETLVPLVLQQLVTGAEATRAFRNAVRTWSEPAPGPFPNLWLPLDAERLRAIPPAAWPAVGALPRQGRTLHEIGLRARRLEEAAAMAPDACERRLRAIPGIGAWTAREAMLRGLGHADTVPLGDFHLPRLVAHVLAGEPDADDARMLELLEPHRPQRGRLVRWILAAGALPPRRAPRPELRPIDPAGAGLLRAARRRGRRGRAPGT